jgi:hypothetical protein
MSKLQTKFIEDSSINSTKIADGAVALVDMAGNSVDSSKIVDNSTLFADLNLASIKANMGVDGRLDLVSYEENDFVCAVNPPYGWILSASGTGASGAPGTYGMDSTQRAIGVYQIDTGSLSTGRAGALFAAAATVVFNGNYCTNEVTFRLALEQLSTAAQTFTAYVGFIDNTGSSGDMTHAIYFRYTNAVNAGKWECVVRKFSSESAADTGVTASTNYATFRILVNAAGTSAGFYINGTLVGTLATANIPTASSIGFKIQKTVGATQSNMSVDYFSRKSVLTSSRG